MFADIACRHGWQVLSIDLPEHGERRQEKDSFVPWKVVPELQSVMEFARYHWTHISLFANSIGAWFSMISFENEPLEKSLFVSPVPDMKQIILNMMLRANVSEEQLKREGVIPASSGQTLSWEYLIYAREHSIAKWNVPAKILYGGNDDLIERRVAEQFAYRHNCDLTVMENGEHWFHAQAVMRPPESRFFRSDFQGAVHGIPPGFLPYNIIPFSAEVPAVLRPDR